MTGVTSDKTCYKNSKSTTATPDPNIILTSNKSTIDTFGVTWYYISNSTRPMSVVA